MGIFNKLFKTREKIGKTLTSIFKSSKLNENDFIKIEECLLSADISWDVTQKVIFQIKNEKDYKNLDWETSLKKIFEDVLMKTNNYQLQKNIVMIGVNGVGKTTASAKLAHYFKKQSKNVLLVAGDTYRAAAIDQLKLWSDSIGVDIISNFKTKDPASIVYDGVNSSLSRKSDFVIIDTAGRLQTSSNLMNELEKLYRVISKITNEISVLINLDANIGQNGLNQVKEFGKYIPINGIILNKMDGTAKGGVALSITDKYKIPILFLGLGEKIEDIIPFNIDNYINSLIMMENN